MKEETNLWWSPCVLPLNNNWHITSSFRLKDPILADWISLNSWCIPQFTDPNTIHIHGFCVKDRDISLSAPSPHQTIIGITNAEHKKMITADQQCHLVVDIKRVKHYHTGYGLHFWPFSKTMRTVFSGSVWKNSSVSTPVPSSSSSRAPTHSTLNESLTWESTYTSLIRILFRYGPLHRVRTLLKSDTPQSCELLPAWAWNVCRLHRWWINEWVTSQFVHGHFESFIHTRMCPCFVALSLVLMSPCDHHHPQLHHNTSRQPLNTSHPLLTLLIRSSRVSAMMPFFMLRSAFVTLKGLSRGARPDRSCWVMEALAVTHLRKAIRHTFIMLNCQLLWQCWPSYPTQGAELLLGEGRWSQKAEGIHSVIHQRAPPPATGSSISLAVRL